jgi:hypothetical protein
VYEPLVRRDMARLAWLDPLVEATAAGGALLIYMDADISVLRERLESRGDDYVTADQLADIQAGYAGVVDRWVAAGGQIVKLDTTYSFPTKLMVRMAATTLLASR